MAHYQVFHKDHEVIGQVALEIQTAIGGENIYPIYERHGLTNVNPQAWYPMQNLLDVFNDFEARGGAMFDLVSVGMKTVENLVLPPEASSLPLLEMFQLSAQIYLLNSRGSNIGTIDCEALAPNHVKLTYIVPMPSDFMYGIVYAFGRRFSAPGTPITVYYDEDIPRREDGGTATIIHAQWNPQR